jgi:flagellar hook-basal body complex protein FliE
MSVESIAAIATSENVATFLPTASTQKTQEGNSFASWIAQEVGSVNSTIINADSDIQKLAVGEAQSLHEVMIHLEEAKLSFQLLAQVRNKLLEAYQEVMRMQV